MISCQESSLRVLVADDSRTIRRFIVDTLRKGDAFIQVEEANDGISCSQHLISGGFDIAFVDVNMPCMDGLAAVAKARSEGVETFIAIMSTDVGDENLKSARKLHAYEFLTKPFSENDVRTIVENYRRFQTMSKVLVVDDSKAMRSMVRKVLDLTFLNFAFFEAPDGQAALDLLTTKSFDIVFLDVNMPGLSGIDVLAELREHNPDVSVVMITADNNEDIRRSIESLSVQHILYKPFFPKDVDRVLHQLFGLRAPELNGGAVEAA